MAKVPGFAKAFAGRWRIVEMDNWDSDFLDLVEEAHLTLATIQASFANAAEFFNSLLGPSASNEVRPSQGITPGGAQVASNPEF